MIQYLTRIFNFKDLFNYDNFTNLNEEDSIKFINDLNNISSSLKSSKHTEHILSGNSSHTTNVFIEFIFIFLFLFKGLLILFCLSF